MFNLIKGEGWLLERKGKRYWLWLLEKKRERQGKLRVLFVSNNSWKFNGILEYVLGETMESVHRQ